MSGKLTLWAIGIVGFGLALNGLFMLGDPILWFDTTPGVKRTGAPNLHFIRDIGIIYAQVGAMMLLGLKFVAHRFVLVMSAGVWLLGHAIFHTWEWAVCITTASQVLVDLPGVFLPGIAVPLLALAVRSQSKETA